MNARKQKTVDNIDKYIFSSLKYGKNIILSLLNEGLSTETFSIWVHGQKVRDEKNYMGILYIGIPLGIGSQDTFT